MVSSPLSKKNKFPSLICCAYLGIFSLLITFIEQTVNVNYDLVIILEFNRSFLIPSFQFFQHNQYIHVPYLFQLHGLFHTVKKKKTKFALLNCCAYLRIFTLLIALIQITLNVYEDFFIILEFNRSFLILYFYFFQHNQYMLFNFPIHRLFHTVNKNKKGRFTYLLSILRHLHITNYIHSNDLNSMMI